MDKNTSTVDAKDIKSLHDLLKQLPDTYFPITSFYNAVDQYDFRYIPEEYRTETKDKVNTLLPGLMVVYLFALFESYIDKNVWYKLTTPKDSMYENADIILRLKAYKHIRHSFGHNPNGERARDHDEDFNIVMASKRPLKDVAVNKNCISLSFSSIEELISIMRSVTGLVIIELKMPKNIIM